MKLKTLTASLIMSAVASSSVLADNAPAAAISPDQVKAFENVIHDYLVQHPEVLLEASQALQSKQQQEMQQQAKSAILQNANDLIKENLTVAGNPKGNVTLVEFFDYQCGHCVKMKPIVNELVKKDPNLRVVYREFPIFGKSSELASRAALAAALQGKYLALQDVLFNMNKDMNQETIMNAAKGVGIDVTKLQADMNSKAVSDALEANRKLAEKMRLMGTPAFIVLSTPAGAFKANSEPAFIPGAASQETLQNLISKAGKA